MSDCAAIKTKLDAAISALDRLTTGGSVRVFVDSDGSRVEYNAANRQSLVSYIQLLQAQYNSCVNGRPAVMTRPLNFVF